MKIILLSGSIYSIQSMHFFGKGNMLQGVVSLGDVDKHNIQVEHNAQLLNLPFKRFLKNELFTGFKNWLIEMQADMALVFGCAYKIPGELLAIPKLGFYNVHFSLLPAYRGKDPVFWQLKNGENTGGITIHKMAEEYDTGPILIQQEIVISPGENYGLYSGRLSMESIGIIAKGVEKLENLSDNKLHDQDEKAASYLTAPSLTDLKINWETQSAREIENLVNAANPDYGGAVTLFRGQPFRILEVNLAEINNPADFIPGTIVHSDLNYGLFAACKNSQFLRINIVQSPEGIFSGFKLAGLGIAAGERFESAGDLSGISIKL
jgi:methionyl-tRNA formyltransferase